jgi:RNA polymerase sigma-70 factor (ECF subfamily)
MMDEELVAQCQRGTREAYAELVRRHSRLVFAVCLGILGDVSDSEDAGQEVLIRGFTRIGDLREGTLFSTWITRIARNHCVDLLRETIRRRELLARELGRSATGSEPPALFQDRARERSRSGDPRYDGLRLALGGLHEKYRMPLTLYYFEGRSTQKVAEALEISEAGVLTRLSRARKELRKQLARMDGSDGSSRPKMAG